MLKELKRHYSAHSLNQSHQCLHDLLLIILCLHLRVENVQKLHNEFLLLTNVKDEAVACLEQMWADIDSRLVQLLLASDDAEALDDLFSGHVLIGVDLLEYRDYLLGVLFLGLQLKG